MEGCVKWGQFVVVILAVVGILTGLFMYVMDIHSSRPHQDAATVAQVESIRQDNKESRKNMAITRESIAGMVQKMDNIQNSLDEMKRMMHKP